MTAAAQPLTQPEPTPPRPPVDGADASAFGDLVRFQAQDGLFLRAEHLTAMQTYAAQLARSVGIATGTGVVYGFRPEVTADYSAVEIGPGLAIDPQGRPLHATEEKAVLKFADFPLGDDEFWVLEIARTAVPFGTEQVFGNLCDDPCSGSALQPWLAEGVVARLKANPMPNFTGVPSKDKRSWLASAYFEQQRQLGQPWLVPAGPGGAPIAPITSWDWTDVADAPTAIWVPLAVLWRDGDDRPLDIWTARREINGRLADDRWRARLAMRPWNTFLAQLLQFQDQLSGLPAGWADTATAEAAADVDALWEGVNTFVKAVSDTPVKNWNDYKQLLATLEQTSGQHALLSAGTPLRELGFRELPPAGFLPAPQGDLRTVVRGWFADLDVRFVDCRADHLPSVLEQARDLDRIPLRPTSTQPHIDILIPQDRADIDPLEIDTDQYGWIAFARRNDVRVYVPPPELDVVEVHHLRGALDDTISAYASGRTPEEVTVTTVAYPRDGWEYPGEAAAGSITLVTGDVHVLAVTRSMQRRPLGVLRASLFFASLLQEDTVNAGRTVRQVHPIVPAEPGEREIIVVLQPFD